MKRKLLHLNIKQLGLSYSKIGSELGVTKGTISLIVNCHSNPSWSLQQRMVNYFGIPAEILLAVEND